MIYILILLILISKSCNLSRIYALLLKHIKDKYSTIVSIFICYSFISSPILDSQVTMYTLR